MILLGALSSKTQGLPGLLLPVFTSLSIEVLTQMLFQHSRTTKTSILALAAFIYLSSQASRPAHAAPTLKIEIDARDLPRRLVHSRINVPCEPGNKLKLWYPKWVPGTHGPLGPVQNVGGLRIETAGGKTLKWQRDELELFRVDCDVPDGVREVTVLLDTICNEPAAQAAGYLTFGNNLVGIFNWGTCVMYPEGFPCDDIKASLSLRLPSKWKFATALKSEATTGGLATFQTVSLTELADCPLIAGEYLRSIPLTTGPYPPAFLDIVSESNEALELSPKVIEMYSRVVREAGKLTGVCHYPDYHFLVTCSDDLGYLGLEHLTSSINGVRERDLIDDSSARVGSPTCSRTSISTPGAASSAAPPECPRPTFTPP